MSRAAVVLCLVAGTLGVGCGGGQDEGEIRGGFETMRTALADRDYAAAWEFMDSSSKDALAKQLRDFQDPGLMPIQRAAAESALRQLGLSVEAIEGMDARAYFVAMLEGMDRTQPELRKRQIEETRGRKIVGLSIDGDQAEMTTETPSGAKETFTWVRESGGWKVKATSVGEGLE